MKEKALSSRRSGRKPIQEMSNWLVGHFIFNVIQVYHIWGNWLYEDEKMTIMTVNVY